MLQGPWHDSQPAPSALVPRAIKRAWSAVGKSLIDLVHDTARIGRTHVFCSRHIRQFHHGARGRPTGNHQHEHGQRDPTPPARVRIRTGPFFVNRCKVNLLISLRFRFVKAYYGSTSCAIQL